MTMELWSIGTVESSLTDPAAAPKQGTEGAPEAWLNIHPAFREALDGIRAGDRIVVLTWLHLADRGELRVHPRDDPSIPMRGVFATRSADRPNPVGLHVTDVVSIETERVKVSALEAVNGTPIIDLKPSLGSAVAPRGAPT